MTAFKDLWRHPLHNGRAHSRVQNVPPRFNDFSFAGGSFRQTVRAAIPAMPKRSSR